MANKRKLTRNERATIARRKGKTPWGKTMRWVLSGGKVFGMFLAMAVSAGACEDANFTPKEFYSIEGRKKCWNILQEGCVCRIMDAGKTYPVENCQRHDHPENRCNCKVVLMCYENECINKEVCDEC